MNTIMDTWNKEDLSIFKELEHLRKNCCHVDFCSSVLEASNYKKINWFENHFISNASTQIDS